MTQQAATVLVVDDIAENRELLTRRLHRYGHTVLEAEHGKAALEQLTRHAIDLVLLDIMMPVMDGFALLERIQLDHKWREIPVIVISAADEMDGVVRCIQMGAEDYLTKPFNSVLLKARIDASLQKKWLRDRELEHQKQLQSEQQQSTNLLRALFPDVVLADLKNYDTFRPRSYQDVVVLFCDVVGFTAFCENRDPEEVVHHLQCLVEGFDAIVETHHLEKIKTIGDCYMAAAGLLQQISDPVMQCVNCGLAMLDHARSTPPNWELRVGIHAGPVVAGVVGSRRYSFDIWGDTVNTAARVESHSEPGAVNLSEDAWQRIAEQCTGEARQVEVKGKGQLTIWRFVSKHHGKS